MFSRKNSIFYKTIQIFGCIALFTGWTEVSHAQMRPPGNMGRWDYLGRAQVNGRLDHDHVDISAPRPYRAIQLEVQNAAVEFRRVTVYFQNGSNQILTLRNRIPAGGRTRSIDLSGNRRMVRSIEFWYGRANWGLRPPTVVVYGQL